MSAVVPILLCPRRLLTLFSPAVKRLGSYESWTDVIGGILQHAGIEGFLENILEFYEIADTEGAVWRQFVAAWWKKFGTRHVAIGDLFPLASEIEGFDLGKGNSERAQKTTFGMKLAQQKDRIFDEYRVGSAGTVQRARLWRLSLAKNSPMREPGEDKEIY